MRFGRTLGWPDSKVKPVGVTRHCGTCGWPSADDPCTMCGSPLGKSQYLGGGPVDPPPSGPKPEDYPELAQAFRAWKVQNFEQVVELCLAHCGIRERSQLAPEGTIGWTSTLDSAAIYITYAPAQQVVVVESPVVWIPEHQRVPLMRTLLELNASTGAASRFAVRGSTVLLRFTDRMPNVAPPKLLDAVREVAQSADAHDNWLAEVFGAKMIGPEAIRHDLDWKYVGRPVQLPGLATDDRPPTQRPATRRFAELMAQAIAVADAYDPQGTGPVSGMIYRALLYAAHQQCIGTSPTAVSVLLHHGAPLLAAPPDRELPAGPVAARIKILHSMGEELDRLAPIPVAPVRPLDGGVRGHISHVIARLRKLPADARLQRTVLSGLASELILRAPIPAAQVQRLREAIDQGTAEGLYRAVVGSIPQA